MSHSDRLIRHERHVTANEITYLSLSQRTSAVQRILQYLHFCTLSYCEKERSNASIDWLLDGVEKTVGLHGSRLELRWICVLPIIFASLVLCGAIDHVDFLVKQTK